MTDVAVQVARFAGVGGLATIIHITAAFTASRVGTVEPLLANTFGFFCAFMVTYVGNYYWTFPGLEGHRTSFARFLALAASAFAISTGIVFAGSTVLGWPFAASLIIVAMTVPPVNFMLSWLWVFRRDDDATAVQVKPDLLLLMLGLAAAAWFYSGTQLNHDSSWYLIATPRWLDGAELYRDILEINPPLAFYLTAPSVFLSRATGMVLDDAFMLQVVALSLASLLWFRSLLQRSAIVEARRRILLAAAFAALCLTPIGEFGQRDHLMVVFALPYIGLMAFTPVIGRTERGLIGAFAVLGLALKPYFLALPLLMGLLLLLRQRTMRAPLTVEHLAIGGGSLLYALAVWMFYPAYFTEIVPAGRLVYAAYQGPVAGVLLVPGFFAAAALLILTARLPKGFDRDVAVTLVAVCAAFVVAYLVQFKGWEYQRVPIYSALCLWGAWLAVVLFARGNLTHLGDVVARSVLLSMAAAIVALQVLSGPYYNGYAVRLAPHLHGADSFMAFTTNVSVTYPLANETATVPTTRYSALWLIPGAVSQLASSALLTAQRREALQQVLERARRTTAEDFLQGRPDVVFVDAREAKPYFGGADFDYIAFFKEDPDFRAAWQQYALIGTEAGFEIWRRGRQPSH